MTDYIGGIACAIITGTAGYIGSEAGDNIGNLVGKTIYEYTIR